MCQQLWPTVIYFSQRQKKKFMCSEVVHERTYVFVSKKVREIKLIHLCSKASRTDNEIDPNNLSDRNRGVIVRNIQTVIDGLALTLPTLILRSAANILEISDWHRSTS